MREVGIRELKNRLGRVMRAVRGGDAVTVTHRNEPVAVLVPLRPGRGEEGLEQLVRAGRLDWSGGKPRGAGRPPRVRGPSVARAVVEDRR